MKTTNKINSIVFTSMLFSIVAMQNCRKCKCKDPSKPECGNYDPCYGKRKINTWFRLKGGDSGWGEMKECGLIDCDTWGASVLFIAPTGNPSTTTYEWKIGTDPTRYTKPKFSLGFNIGYEKSVPVTLIIRTPFSACLENAADTFIKVTRKLFITNKAIGPHYDETFGAKPTSVKYEGYFKHEPNKKIVLNYFTVFEEPAIHIEFVAGYDLIDTISYEVCDKFTVCSNLKHRKITKIDNSKCTIYGYDKTSNHTIYNEYYLDNDKLYDRRDFLINGKTYVREFVGTRIK